MNAGDTFIPQCKPYNHLYIVLSDPSQDEERVVLVNLTTWTVDEESHCIVQKGEHRFVKHKTAVRYNGAKLASVSELERLTNTGMLKSDRPLSPELLKESEMAPRWRLTASLKSAGKCLMTRTDLAFAARFFPA